MTAWLALAFLGAVVAVFGDAGLVRWAGAAALAVAAYRIGEDSW